MSLVAGEKLGPYEILEAIGAGGIGEVYKARDTRLDRTPRKPRLLFRIPIGNHPLSRDCDVTADGQRFLVLAPAAEP